MHETLAPKLRQRALEKLPDWKKVRGREAIEKTYVFPNFAAAFAWMTKIALKAEQMNHHPEWSNVYNKVIVTLTTHDSRAITQLDIDLATYMDKSAGHTGRSIA